MALPPPEDDTPAAGSLDSVRREAEETLLRRALAGHRHNITRTAEHLGVSRVTLYRLLEKHGIATRPE